MVNLSSSARRRAWVGTIAAGALAIAVSLPARQAATQTPAQSAAQTMADPQTAVNNAYSQFKSLNEGKNADYIPALAKVDPNLYGIVLITADGKTYSAGDIN